MAHGAALQASNGMWDSLDIRLVFRLVSLDDLVSGFDLIDDAESRPVPLLD
jgi:hypothetical protein